MTLYNYPLGRTAKLTRVNAVGYWRQKTVMAKKAYYYYAETNIEHQRYFRAINKKQIKKYLRDSFVDFGRIFDPTDKPTDGIRYIDVTNIKTN